MNDCYRWSWSGRIVAAIAVLDSGPADGPPPEAASAVDAALSALLAAQQAIVRVAAWADAGASPSREGEATR